MCMRACRAHVRDLCGNPWRGRQAGRPVGRSTDRSAVCDTHVAGRDAAIETAGDIEM